MAVVFKKITEVRGAQSTKPGVDTSSGQTQMLGGNFDVSVPTKLYGVGWNRIVGSVLRSFGIWNASTGAFLGGCSTTSTNTIPAFGSPITLLPGNTYTVAVQVFSGETYSSNRVPGMGAPFTLGVSKSLATNSFVLPTNTGTSSTWNADITFDYSFSTSDTKLEAPELTVLPGASNFTLILPEDWMPTDGKEWDLQYSVALDSANFGNWLDIGTFAIGVSPDNAEDADAEPEVTGSYQHTPLQVPTPKPYYRYRYRVRTATQQSDWSEIAYAGQLRNVSESTQAVQPGAVTGAGIASGTITSGNLNVSNVKAAVVTADAILAGTASIGGLTAAYINVGSITAATVTATAMSAAIANISGSLSSVSSNLGLVTAGILQSGTGGARVMVGTNLATSEGFKNGIVGVDASNNITFLLEPATGDARFKGMVMPNSTGLGNIDGLTQNATLVAGGSLLSDNPSLDTTDLTPFSGSNLTLTRDTTTFFTSPASLKGVATATGAADVTLLRTGGASRIPVVAGNVYSFAVNVRAPKSLVATLTVTWYNSTASSVGTSSITLGTLANQWKKLTYENLAAPAGAITVLFKVSITGHAVADAFYYDNWVVVKGAAAIGAVVVAGSITATEIFVQTLSAITADLGTITAGNITGTVITGATIQTDASPTVNRLYLDNTGLYARDTTNASVVSLTGAGGFSIVGYQSAFDGALVSGQPARALTFTQGGAIWATLAQWKSTLSGFGTFNNASLNVLPHSVTGSISSAKLEAGRKLDGTYDPLYAVIQSTSSGYAVAETGNGGASRARYILGPNGLSDYMMTQGRGNRQFIAFGELNANVPAGWSSYGVPWFDVPNVVLGTRHGVIVSVSTGNGASIVGHHVMAHDANGCTVAVNSTLNQSVYIWAMCFSYN